MTTSYLPTPDTFDFDDHLDRAFTQNLAETIFEVPAGSFIHATKLHPCESDRLYQLRAVHPGSVAIVLGSGASFSEALDEARARHGATIEPLVVAEVELA